MEAFHAKNPPFLHQKESFGLSEIPGEAAGWTSQSFVPEAQPPAPTYEGLVHQLFVLFKKVS